MNKKKWQILFIFLFVFTLLFIVLGIYAGGATFYKLTNIPMSYLTFNSLFEGWQSYGDVQEIKKYLMVGSLVTVLVSLFPCIFTLIIYIAAREKEELHGSARFANDMDLAKSGLFPNPNNKAPTILLGKMPKGRFKNKFIELDGALFACVDAPTRSGKGVGLVIPNCVTFPHSMVVSDIKFENFVKSAGFREKYGQEVFLFAPDGYAFSEEEKRNNKLRTHRWNPFDYVRRDKSVRVGDILNIANTLYPTTGDKNDIWNELAGRLFKGLACWMIDTEHITGRKPSLPYTLELVSVSGGLRAWMSREVQQEYVSKDTISEFNLSISQAEETYSSVESNLLSPLAIFEDHVVAEAVSDSDFDFRDLRRKKMTIYVGCQPARIGSFQKLLNLFFEQLIMENTKTLPEHDPELKYQCLMLLDEFTALGRIQQIEKAIGYTAGYGLRFLTIFQDESQIMNDRLYGREGGKNILANHAVRVIYPPKEVTESVKRISATLGTKTVKQKKTSRSTGKSSSKTYNDNEHKRELMMPHEIVELGFEKHPKATSLGTKILLLKENQRPFIADKIIYFDEPIFNERVKYSEANIPDIPLIDVN